MTGKNEELFEIESSKLKKMVFASLFAALIAAGAYIKIPLPFSPVPITIQVFFVFLAGALLKSKWGSLSVLVYILLGIAGLPVFSGGASGIGLLFGPTGGYILGFGLAAFIIGFLSEKSGKSGFFSNFLFMSVGLCLIYACGLAQLAFVAKFRLLQSLSLGLLPFLPGDLLKLTAAAYIASRFKL
ncbi:MAG: biotin transporter BioY [Methanosarcinaceae archaeon]|nr:biotin transporter BioY [Methanosarcinaceae archaeon]MDD4749751.1 biotin transporter BioY [Methanosarcinaceae archaeon]